MGAPGTRKGLLMEEIRKIAGLGTLDGMGLHFIAMNVDIRMITSFDGQGLYINALAFEIYMLRSFKGTRLNMQTIQLSIRGSASFDSMQL
eukprot:evm.model.scf_836.1 EVM.evm.TU.scf_836.1   scf_836:7584-9017(+)